MESGGPLVTSSRSGVLDGIPLFESFTRAERDGVAARGRTIDVPMGTVLVREGEEGDALYVIVRGEVRVLRRDASGVDVEIGRRAAGECFGEMALLDGGRRSATVETASDSRIFILERDLFLEVVSPSPALMSKLLRELSRKIRDVSERVVREDLERRTRAAEAEAARHRAITQAVTGLAHELNTPLGICVTTASLIDAFAAAGPEDLGEPLALLRDNLDRVVSLVQTFTAIAALHHAEPLEDLDLGEVLEQAAMLFGLERPDRPLAVRVAVVGPRPWLGYRTPMVNALFHLFDNAALHAYPPDDPRPVAERAVEIAVACDRLDGRPAWRITVTDRGVGIAEEARRKLFDAFFTTARSRGHKGLGLTIAYNIVTGPLCGRIAVAAADGGGTCVTMLVPAEL